MDLQKMALVHAIVKLGEKETVLEAPEGTSVEALVKKLEAKWRDNVLVISNGKAAKATDLLYASDRVLILPLLAGG
jgi:molybdopterin converting factor small subunit